MRTLSTCTCKLTIRYPFITVFGLVIERPEQSNVSIYSLMSSDLKLVAILQCLVQVVLVERVSI